jgi:membrane protease subunit (stomatin/prohibitin family)
MEEKQMGFFRNQLLKVIEWEDTSSNTIAYKFPIPAKAEIMNGSQLIVREGQVAILVSSGKLADVYPAGRYKLETGNMPLLTQIMGWKYGFRSPFVCDVVFINTRLFTAQRWGTSSPVMMRDQDFGVVQFVGYGQFSFRVKEPETFLRELLGSGLRFETDDIIDQLKNTIVSGITESVASSNVPALDLAMRYTDLERVTADIIRPVFGKMGLELAGLEIINLSLTEDSKKALTERTRMNILGSASEYTAFAAADSMKTMAENAHKGGVGNVGGIGLGLGTGAAMAGLYTQTIAGSQAQAAQAPQKQVPQVACPSCGAPNNAGAKFCNQCGAKLSQKPTCAQCGAELSAGAKFCPNCGGKVGAAAEKTCPKCGEKVAPQQKFCSNCGSAV